MEEEDVNFEAMTLEERKKYCEDLDDFMNDVEESVKAACATLGWTYESVDCELEPFMTCPFNRGHRVPERTMEKHLKTCEWNSLGYTKECKPLPEPCVSEESPSTIKFDIQLQHKVLQEAKRKNPKLNIGKEEKLIPQTSDRLMSDFTPDERKAMYEYVIANTVAPDIGQDIADLNKPETSKSANEPSNQILELLAQERNLKRRRIKHRGVHTNKKSHTEVLREIVEKQMEMFKEYLAEKHGIPIPDDKEDSSNEDDRLRDKNDFENSSRSSSSKREYQKDLDQSKQSNNSKNRYSRGYDRDHKNSSRDYQEPQSFSRKSNRSDDRYGKHESRRRDRYNSSDRYNEKRNNGRRNDSGSRDRHHSENHKHLDDCDSRNRYYDDNDSRDRRRDDSDSRDKRRDDNNSQDHCRNDSGSRNKRRDYYDDDSQDRHRDDSDSRNKRHHDDDCARDGHRTGSRSKYRDENDSRGKSCNQNNSWDYSETCDNSDSRDRKRDRSRSRKRKTQKKLKRDSKERSNHKKHKKDKKKKREKSVDSDNDHRKHKASKSYRDRNCSRSRSH